MANRLEMSARSSAISSISKSVVADNFGVVDGRLLLVPCCISQICSKAIVPVLVMIGVRLSFPVFSTSFYM